MKVILPTHSLYVSGINLENLGNRICKIQVQQLTTPVPGAFPQARVSSCDRTTRGVRATQLHVCACFLVYLFTLFILPILHIPSHAAPGADGIAGELAAKSISILEEIEMILHRVLLDQLGEITVCRLTGSLIECAAGFGNRFICFRVDPAEVIATIGVIWTGDVRGE